MNRLTLLFLILFSSCSPGKATIYTGSTPATSIAIRMFLNIPLKDSVDFIRWKLQVDHNTFSLHCNYGIGKPNTDGFMNGGKSIHFEGNLKNIKNQYQLQFATRSIKLIALNQDILHFMEENNKLMVGHAGWSYTLNNSKPSGTREFNFETASVILTDSVAFQGRTPCEIPGLQKGAATCYKLKWHITLYPDTKNISFGTFRLFGTNWRTQEPKTGHWKLIKTKEGRILYSFFEENNNSLFTLLKAGEDIVYFTDVNGNPLVGNEDFSYSLNRKN